MENNAKHSNFVVTWWSSWFAIISSVAPPTISKALTYSNYLIWVISSLLYPFSKIPSVSKCIHPGSICEESFVNRSTRTGCTYDSMPRGKSWLMATVALKFFLLSLHTSSLPRWGGLKMGRDRQTQRRCFSSIFERISNSDFLVTALNKFLIMTKTVENMRCLLSVLCSDVLFPRNCVGHWSCEGLPSHRLGTRKYQSVAFSQSSGYHYYWPLVDEVRTPNYFSLTSKFCSLMLPPLLKLSMMALFLKMSSSLRCSRRFRDSSTRPFTE